MTELGPLPRPPGGRRIGSVLNGKWRIDEKLGSGGMSTVYSATHVKNGAKAAIKLLHDNLARHAELVSRFLREGTAANKVQHAGIVRVLDEDTGEDGVPYLVVELLQGSTLEQKRNLAGGRMPIADVLRYIDGTLDALAHAHAAGVIHRDLKPDNLFVTDDGVLKILDFGLARLLERVDGVEQTQTGIAIGTPEFMAPEQAKARRAPVDARADVWGIGATLFVLISGRYVHNEMTLHEQLAANASKPAQSLAKVAPFAPRPIVLVVDKALSLEKEDRYPDALALRLALRAAALACGLDGSDDHKTLPIGVMRFGAAISVPKTPVASPDEDSDELATLHGQSDAMATLALARSPIDTSDDQATLVPRRPMLSVPDADAPMAIAPSPPVATPRSSTRTRTWIVGGAALLFLFVVALLVGLGLRR